MKQLPALLIAVLSFGYVSAGELGPFTSEEKISAQSGDFTEYFRSETKRLSDRCLAEVQTLSDWTARRSECRRQLQEMLGLWPLPERTDLNPVITGKLEQEDFVVEKLYFQAMPHLYVTANLYRPKKVDHPLPAILYVCGHARVATNGVSCGNKTFYQHHGVWFARNGYVCLLIDTLELGEIEGQHHGTYRDGQWWWNTRGYTPAGVEAWFGIRALDYLCSRQEVDKERIGMTGRSGGGSYTWTVAALDERVKVAAPVAGMTDLQNQVVDGAVEGHCDCMFFVNTYRWDFPEVAALIAPRPLLIGNSDKDPLFPLDGVTRLYFRTRRIYQLYNATNQLGLLITEGPHADTQELQLPVFRWFNRYLKKQDPLIEMAAKKVFPPEQLRVFDKLPNDQINTRIQETFVPMWQAGSQNQTLEPLREALREKVFRAWPDQLSAVPPQCTEDYREGGLRFRSFRVETQPGIVLPLWMVENSRAGKPEKIALTILDSGSWTNWPMPQLRAGRQDARAHAEFLARLRQQARQQKTALAFFAPRGVEPAPWPAYGSRMAPLSQRERGRGEGDFFASLPPVHGKDDPKKAVQVRRRFMLLGETLDSMRVWDIQCAALAIRSVHAKTPLELRARGTMGVNAAYAALFNSSVRHLTLADIPASHRQGPDYLNVLKITDIPQVLQLLGNRVEVNRQ